jgi:hypothetical protein
MEETGSFFDDDHDGDGDGVMRSSRGGTTTYKPPRSPGSPGERTQGQTALEMLHNLYPSLAKVNPVIPMRGRVATDTQMNAQALLWKAGRRELADDLGDDETAQSIGSDDGLGGGDGDVGGAAYALKA